MMQLRRTRLSLVVALMALVAFVLPVATVVVSQPQSALAQTKQYHMDRYDANITVNTDGSLDIQENLVYVFTSGSFRRGVRTWDLSKLDNITNIKVAENRNGVFVNYRETDFDPDSSTTGATGTYGTEIVGSTQRTRWIYGNTSNATRTFRLTYHVTGATRVYADRD